MNPNIIKKFHLSSNDENLSKDEDTLIKNNKITSNNNNLPNNNSFHLYKKSIFKKNTLCQDNDFTKNINPKKIYFKLFKENSDYTYIKNSFSHSFHINFNNLRIKLGIDDSRKTHIDSLLKKAKSKCLKAIHEVLKLSLNLLIERLPQNFITNIKIDFNKKYLAKSIGEIYYEYKLLPTYDEILKKDLIKKGRLALFTEIYNSSFKNVYTIYIESDLYKKDFEKIFLKDGQKIASLYDYVAKNMCEYFLLSKGNKKKVFKNTFLGRKKKIFNIN